LGGGSISDEGVLKFVAKLLTDEKFRGDFYDDPQRIVTKSGFKLSDEEIEALTGTDQSGMHIDLDITLQKAPDVIHLGISHFPAPDKKK
jgi:hypothetical protein